MKKTHNEEIEKVFFFLFYPRYSLYVFGAFQPYLKCLFQLL